MNPLRKLKKLFEEGKNEVEALDESLSNNDLTSAKKHFLSSMKIFTNISHQLTTVQTTYQTETNTIQTVPTPQMIFFECKVTLTV